MTTYIKLKSGDWGLRVDGRTTSGARVTVTKASGETKSETIGQVLWTGADKSTGQTISLCTIRRQANGPRAGGETKTCWECGCTFSYADCRANDGDWQDSYCGC